MEQILVTRLDGSTFGLQSKTAGSSITNAVQNVELLGVDTVDITVISATKLTFTIGDKITIIGKPYTLNTPAKEKKAASNNFQYDLQFEGVQYDLLRASYSVNVDTTSNQIQDLNGDSLTGDLKRFLDVLISNANRVFPGKWSLGTYPAATETVTETFSESDNCLSVLQTLCGPDKYNTEFSISVAVNGHRTLNVGAIGSVLPFTLEYGKGRGIYELTREKQSSSNIITRLSVFGSSKNIMTSKYKIGESFRGLKLCLPNKTKANSILESATAIAKYGVWESVKTFEDIFPHRSAPITALGDSELKFVDSTMFDLNATDGSGNTLYLIPGTSAKVHFNSGNLAGYEFEIASYDHATKTFTLIPFTDENGYTFPSKDTAAFQFKVGDEFTFVDIYMPQSYIDAAEAKLQTAGQAYLDKYSQPFVQYGLTVDSFFLKNVVGAEADTNIIWAGDYVPIKDTDIEVDKTIRVKGFTRDLLKDYAYNLTIADLTTNVSIINRVITDLKELDTVVKINSLNDPARARRNFKATTEVVSMIEAIQAEAALIGNNPASQYELTGVFIRPNYNKNANTIDITAGVLAHNYYPVGNPGTWNISAGNFAGLTAGTAYYIYIKASKSAATAVYFVSSTKIAVEAVGGYYHFPLGVLSSVIDGARVFTTTKGYTLITGDSIKTGRISSNDGSTYFDLTTGEFKGVFKFTSGTSVETAVSDAQTAASSAQGTAATAQSAASSAQSTASAAQSTANSASTNATTALNTSNSIAQTIEAGKIMYEDPMFKSGLNSINVYNNEGNGNVSHSRIAKPSDAPTNSSYILRISNIGTASPGIGGFYFATTARANAVFVTKFIAKVPVGYTIGFASNAIGDNSKTEWLTGNAGTGKYETYIYRVICGSTGSLVNTNFFYFNGAAGTPSVPVTFDLAFCTVYDLTDFVLYDNTKTTIDGGLVTSGTIQVAGDTNILAGMTGNGTAASSVRFWAGGTYANRATAPFRVQQDGKMFATNAEITGKIETSEFKSTGSFVTPQTEIIVGSYSTYDLTDIATKSFISISLSTGSSAQAAIRLPSATTYDGYHCTVTLKVGAYLSILDQSNTVIGAIAPYAGNRSAFITSLGGAWVISYSGERSLIYSYAAQNPGVSWGWYREYSDGWIEQGGKVYASGSQTISLLVPFINTLYTVHVNTIRSSSGSSGYNNVYSMTTTSFYAVCDAGSGVMWSACGFYK